MSGVIWPGLLLTTVLVLHVVATWADRRGWIYYRSGTPKGRGVALSNALAEFEVLLNPAAEHRIEEVRWRAEVAEVAEHGLLADDEVDLREE